MEASPGCNHMATLLDTQTLPPCVLPPYHSTLEKTIMGFPVQKADFNLSHTRKKTFKLEMMQAMFLVRGLAAKQPGSSSLYLNTTFAVQPKLACYKMTLSSSSVPSPAFCACCHSCLGWLALQAAGLVTTRLSIHNVFVVELILQLFNLSG